MIYIDDLIGIRYAINGRDKVRGFDCYGLAIEVLRRMGHDVPDLEEALRMDRNFLNCADKCISRIDVCQIDEPTYEGDILLLTDEAGVINHVGVYLGNGRFIHCNKSGVHIDKVSSFSLLIGRVYTWQ